MAVKNIDVSYEVCPECGFIHPPDPSGRCPIIAAQKNKQSNPNNEVKPKPVIKNDTSNIVKYDIDFSDMLNKIAEITDEQIKQKNITGDDEIKKVKQFVVIELTKAFERYPNRKT